MISNPSQLYCCLIECIDELAAILTDKVNGCLSTGSVSDSLKEAKALLKKAFLNSNILRNDWPVSNPPFVSRFSHLLVHLERNNLCMFFSVDV